jgi:hypothetical protein
MSETRNHTALTVEEREAAYQEEIARLTAIVERDAETRGEPARYDQVPDGCWVACIAGITGLPHDELAALVPKDIEAAYKSPDYHNAVNRYLRAHGWRLAYIGPDVPAGFSVMSGKSPRGLHHATIALDGALWHDPNPSRAGLLPPDEDGYHFEVLIPLSDSPAMRSPRSPRLPRP